MAYSKDQNEPKVPTSNVDKRTTSDLLPRFYRTKSNKKFLQATLDQLTQPGTVKKLNGYIGRQTAKAVTSSDIFLQAADKTRQDYQFEPAAVIQDYLGNTNFFKDYIDHINHVGVFDGNAVNHSRVNKQEFYSWNPQIEWDKFVNYQQYYWLPFGPNSITVLGQQLAIQSTYTVKGVDEEDNVAYLFTPNGLTRNPSLKLYRGQTYVFDIDAPGHPFSIKTRRVSGNLDRYTDGIDAFAIEKGKITFTVPMNSPDVLFYVSENAVDTGGVLTVLDIDENTAIDLAADLLGKKDYVIPNGTSKGLSLSNGMKLNFGGQVTPAEYGEGFWYVEGVGTAIRLVSNKDLEVRTSYNVETNILFDDSPFDQLPFGDASTLPSRKDYVTINRASADRNPWSRYNRWFHKDVIVASANANGVEADLGQAQRATRPIIEFVAGIKLFNSGITAKKNIDVIDTFTTDAFSTVEGSLGYNVDGIDLADGMRLAFTADTDSMVRNKIFKVNFVEVTPPSRQLMFTPEFAINVANNTITFDTEHGLSNANRVTYLENGNDPIPGMVNRQVYYVKVIDTLTIELHTVRQLTKQVDIFALQSGTHKLEVYTQKNRQINLVEESDGEPQLYETVTVNYGITQVLPNNVLGNQGQTYWFNGTTWKLAQQKVTVNQAPLFDIFDSNGNSYADLSTYDGSTFTGTKVFSYKVGTGTADTELSFPLSYLNINNVGDIVFEFNLLKDSFAYKQGTNLITKNTDVGYVMLAESLDQFSFANGWTTSAIENSQPIVRVFKESNLTNNFPVDVYDNKDDLDDLEVRVYVNGKRLAKDSYNVVDGVVRKQVNLNTAVTVTDVVTLRCFASQAKNDNGHYELPISLQNNPLNQNVEQFTLGQVIDHVDSIIDNISEFDGIYPGNGNLRDIGNLSAYGTRFVQHSGPMNLSLYHLGSKGANVVKALDQARNDYGKFKRSFLIAANESGIDTDPRRHVDYVLQALVKDKPKTSAYYLSDMFGYTASNRLEYTVLDPRIKTYPLTATFNLTTLTNKSVIVYLNEEQLLHGRDYIFGDDIFFEILRDLQEDDLIEVFEYDSTDGCFCPSTPTKLGLYPKFEPRRFIDDTYLEPTEVIQGHDGSITVAFGDFRDDLILELERRIFNNIKVKYDPTIFDLFDFIPGYNRPTDYTRDEFDTIISKYFFQWTANIQQDYTKHTFYDQTNTFTYNYRGNYTIDNLDVPAAWRGIYRWLFDTDRPHSHPWECLGFSIEPQWWPEVYGPAPYTSDNFVLWDDIRQGIVREPGRPLLRVPKFAKPILANGVPVDDQGALVSPKDSGLVEGYIRPGDGGYFIFGDQAPVEASWRRSSYYPFALLETCLLMQPNSVLGRCLDRSRTVRNLNDQLVYSETGLRIQLEDIVLPSTYNTNNTTRQYTCGLINYIVDYLSSENTSRITEYANDLTSLTNKMASKLGSFTSKPKYKLLLDSKNPSSTGGVFVPEENYIVALNTSSAIKKLVYSGVVVTKFADGFEIRGYNFDNPYFTYYGFRKDERVIRVGGISESYINWAPGQNYVAGKLIKNNNQFFRVKSSHSSSTTFDLQYYVRLAELPVTGGREAIIRTAFDADDSFTLAYGTKLTTIQSVVDFLQGYGAYLEDQGFVFDDFNNELGTITNWETAVKEFMFWSTQNWGEGAIISLSPAANKLIFKSTTAMVGDITDQFYGYSVFRVDGQKLEPEFITAFRSQGEFVLEPENTAYGIFGATLHLIQKEHIVLLDNTTLFNDTIYDPPAGYRQERLKVLGYVTSNWGGSFEIPGFIYDQAVINSWEPWTDYNLGDIVKYKEFYYSASSFLIGTQEFQADQWILLEEKPEPQLFPNWDYKAEQFTDFYDLDTDNFDADQQKIAQHLIGYQKRQYLENIIQNDVSQYKFYQGMIIEKGTQNVLSKLFDVLSADGQESLTFDEEWAFRVGEYGAVDTFDEIELVLDESQFKINPQPLELVNTIDPEQLDFVYRQKPSDVYIKPIGYTSNVWPAAAVKRYLKTPGYVRTEDVKSSVDSINDLVNIDISTFTEGDYVWATFEGQDWNVYRFSKTDWSITNVTYVNSTAVVTVTCNAVPSISEGDIIGIENSSLLKGFHTVTSVSLNTFTFVKKIAGWTEFTDVDTVLTYQLVSHRLDNIDDAATRLPRYIKSGELLWADDNGQGYWSVYSNSGSYRKAALINTDPSTDLSFGYTTAIDGTGNIAAVYGVEGVTVYEKGSADNTWYPTNRLPLLTVSGVAEYGGPLLRLSKDAKWLFFARPETTLGQPGKVLVYQRAANGNYSSLSEFTSPDAVTPNQYFGSNITVGKTPNPPGSYTGLVGVYDGTGSGAIWNVVRTGAVYTVVNIQKGIEYREGDIVQIFGADLGGETGDTLDVKNDLFITVKSVDISTGAIISFTYTGQGLGDTYMLAISAQGAGKVYTYKHTDGNGWESLPTLTGIAANDYGYDLTMDATGTYLAVSAPAANGVVIVYKFDTDLDRYVIFDDLTHSVGTDDDQERFGQSVTFGGTGEYLAIGSTLMNVDLKKDVGQILVYRLNAAADAFDLYQTIDSPRKEVNERFGTDMEFMNDDETLVVFSKNGDIENIATFDSFSDPLAFAVTSENGYLTTDVVTLVATATRVDNVATITTVEPHELITGIKVSISCTPIINRLLPPQANSFSSSSFIDIVVTSPTTFTYTNNGKDETREITTTLTYLTREGVATQVQSLFVKDQESSTTPITTYDNNNMRLIDVERDIGRIDIFDRYNTKFIYGESLENTSAAFSGYGEEITVGSNVILVSCANETVDGYAKSGNVYSYVKPNGKLAWSVLHKQTDAIDITKIKKVYLYNKETNELITYLDVVDPIQGKIPGPADQEIKYKTYFDPATYSVGTDAVNVDDGMNWTTKQVGMLWWDLSRAKFLDTDDGDIIYRTSSWNKLYETGSIDVYEWVESSVLPAAWNKTADTQAGLAKNISGQTKYGDNVYSTARRYDSISKTFKETYYFWVKNKTIVPNVDGRKISAADTASLIEDPVGYGYSFVAFTGTNSLSLCNIKKYLNSSNVVLNVQYWLSDVKSSNFHSQWKLLSTSANTIIPTAIETKWIHSLVGKDDNDRVVPDINLPAKLRYGIEFRPRQSMFVNRVEAIKQVIERVNTTLSSKLIVDDYDLTDLTSFDPLPTTVSGLWDTTIDTDAELRFVPTTLLQTPSFTPTIVDGRLTGINIVRPGYGYGTLRAYSLDIDGDPVLWYGPDIVVSGSGINAKVKTIIDSQGIVVNTVIENAGEGYDSQTTLSVRDFGVLVKSDASALESWSIYAWNRGAKQWQRVRSQSYDVRKYWDYIDWYATGYNQFNKIDYLVENTYELVTTDIPVGSISKVKNVGTGGWLLLEKFNNASTIDYTENFNVIGRQNGTIKFSDNIYKYQASTLGFDGPLYDAAIFDNSPSKELRVILTAIKDKILVDEYRVDYLKLFFASVQYVLHEQTFIDWAFKTSFVKSMHNVGPLKQKVTYNNDNLEFFEDYINEVKPYRTKVREYVSNYSNLEYAQSSVTDFDLIPVIDERLAVSPFTVHVTNAGVVVPEFNKLTEYPWKHWNDALGFEITNLLVIGVGRGYVTPPIVEITGPQLPGGEPAVAKAYITKGQILRLDLVNPGTKWIKAPTVRLIGGLDVDGRAAAVIATIGNSTVRSSYIKVKFDRISKSYEVDSLTEIQTFTGNGARTQFNLRFSPEIGLGRSYVTVNGIEVLKDQYSLQEVEPGRITTIPLGYTAYTGKITFDVAPPAGSAILVEYDKNFRHQSATDRIKFYYNPSTGQTGKDLAQLMTGVDYGGVQITGLDFGVSVGWDSLPWFTEAWDTVDPAFEDFIVTVSTVTYSFRMPYVPAKGQEINTYVSRYNEETEKYMPAVRIDDPNYLTINQTNDNALMTSFVGDDEVDIIALPTTVALQTNDRVIFRKDTSDGSYAPRDDDYDTKLSGGNLAYSTATGVSAEDISLDGDGFVTPTTSHAPEEVVPGQIMDTVAIKVFHRPSGGCPNILFKTELADGSTDRFVIGQYFLNNDSVIVKVDNTIVNNYTIDYQTNEIVFESAPVAGSRLTIVSTGLNSATVLDLDYFVADGVTTEFITKAPWLPTVSSTVIVNGQVLSYILFSTDDKYTDLVGQTWRSKVGIRFDEAPPVGALINYMIDSSSAEQTASIAKSETIIHIGSASTYELINNVGVNIPLEQNVLVKTNQHILRPPSANYFVMSNDNLTYSLLDHKYKTTIVNADSVKVYRDTTQLTVGTDYTVEFDLVGPSYSIIEDSILINGGLGYSVGDSLDPVGGTLGPSGNLAKFEVTQVSPTGVIRRVEVIDTGTYEVYPTSPIVLSGGTGTGATITADFEITTNKPDISINLRENAYVEGSKLTVVVTSNAEYFIENGAITFTDTWPASTSFEVLSFYNHNVLAIERTVDELIPITSITTDTLDYYDLSGKLGGAFVLRNPVVSGHFVWVVKNGSLLMHTVDYILENDYRTVKLGEYLTSADEVQIIAFTNTVVHDSFAYMQFKDMLNRTHYKRLNKDKTTRLAKDLNQFDKEIHLVDAANYDSPNASKNVPGVLEISGERIEYFNKVGNVLSQIQRGTLGTGVPTYHAKDSLVMGIGASETIPYKDQYTLTTYTSDGIASNQALIDAAILAEETPPAAHKIVEVPYIPDLHDIEVFVGGYRLKKHEYKIYSNALYPESPLGDVTYSAEFTITGRSELRLTSVPAMGIKVVVIKKQGKLWNDNGVRLAKSDNPIANFLKNTRAPWLELNLDKYEDNRVIDPTGSPLQTGDGEPLEY